MLTLPVENRPTSDTNSGRTYQDDDRGGLYQGTSNSHTSDLAKGGLGPGAAGSGSMADTVSGRDVPTHDGSVGYSGYDTRDTSRLDPRTVTDAGPSRNTTGDTTFGTFEPSNKLRAPEETSGRRQSLLEIGEAADEPGFSRTSGENFQRPQSTATTDSADKPQGSGGMSGGRPSLLEIGEGAHEAGYSQRVPGQWDTDTDTRPSGGIAQGGQPQGINLTGQVPLEQHGDSTSTGLHRNPGLNTHHPSSANEPSVPDRGQSRAPVGGFGAVEPSVGVHPTSGQKPLQDQQGANRPGEQPSKEAVEAMRRRNNETEEVASSQNYSSLMPEDSTASERRGSTSEAKPWPERGTGEKWVKTSGFAAQGGDFDAAAPGAGKEADRKLSHTHYTSPLQFSFFPLHHESCGLLSRARKRTMEKQFADHTHPTLWEMQVSSRKQVPVSRRHTAKRTATATATATD